MPACSSLRKSWTHKGKTKLLNTTQQGRGTVTHSQTLESFWSPHISISAMARRVSTIRFLFPSVMTGLRSSTRYKYLCVQSHVPNINHGAGWKLSFTYFNCSNERAFLGFHSTSFHQFFCFCTKLDMTEALSARRMVTDYMGLNFGRPRDV